VQNKGMPEVDRSNHKSAGKKSSDPKIFGYGNRKIKRLFPFFLSSREKEIL
jgi:hypothetical protein